MAGLDEGGLRSSLERLAQADILFVEGDGAQATYRFKHALIQDAAYDSLLRSRRQALHAQAAEILSESASPEPEAVAHHFTQAGLDDPAIEWWGKAGDQALRRSAFQEAISHLGKAIEMADKEGETGSTRDRLKLQTSYGEAMAWSRGLDAEETKAASARATQLAAEVNDAAARLTIYYGQWLANLVGGRIEPARTIAETYLGEARNAGVLHDVALASRLVGQVGLYQGAFSDARVHLETALASYDPTFDIQVRLGQGADIATFATVNLAIVFWQLGEVERARELTELAKMHAVESGADLTVAYTHMFTALFDVFRGDADATLRDAKTIAQAAGIEVPAYSAIAKILNCWARARLNDSKAGLEELRHGLTLYAEHKILFTLPVTQGLLSELEAEGPSAGVALARIDEALRMATQTGGRWTDAFRHRIRGDILLKADPGNPARAEDAYLNAIAIAREQGARSFGLQAALKLAKLYQSTGRLTDAHTALAPALEGFAPTPEMPEIAEAHALLAALAETDEVKVEAAHRQRLTQLHAAYGNALIGTHGYGAPETTEAFARARESASGDKDAPGRLSADYGLWVGSFARGELGAMRELSATMLRDCERRPQSGEASVAHRMRGVTHWFAGEFVAARGHLEQAAAIFDPERDGDLAFRFGLDPGIVAMAYLSQVLWLLGEVGLAGQRMKETTARAAKSGHATTSAYGFFMAAQFELVRRNPDGAAPFAKSLIEVASEHQLAFWMTYSGWFEGWLEWRTGNRDAGFSRMRDTAARQADKGIIPATTFFETTLAEAEAAADVTDVAFCTINRALAVSERTGLGWYEAETHRVRGEILLKRDPGNASPAQEAFLTAIAVAQAQKARSFELRAALALAKLYQSTGRPADAHAVLTPALDGFAPTSQMPEIAEAQALLATLA